MTTKSLLGCSSSARNRCSMSTSYCPSETHRLAARVAAVRLVSFSFPISVFMFMLMMVPYFLYCMNLIAHIGAVLRLDVGDKKAVPPQSSADAIIFQPRTLHVGRAQHQLHLVLQREAGKHGQHAFQRLRRFTAGQEGFVAFQVERAYHQP